MYAFHLAASILFLIVAVAGIFTGKGPFLPVIINLFFAIWGFATLPH